MSDDKRPYHHWTDVEDAKLRELWPTEMTDAEVAKLIGREPGPVRKRADRLGLPTRRFCRHQARQGVHA